MGRILLALVPVGGVTGYVIIDGQALCVREEVCGVGEGFVPASTMQATVAMQGMGIDFDPLPWPNWLNQDIVIEGKTHPYQDGDHQWKYHVVTVDRRPRPLTDGRIVPCSTSPTGWCILFTPPDNYLWHQGNFFAGANCDPTSAKDPFFGEGFDTRRIETSWWAGGEGSHISTYVSSSAYHEGKEFVNWTRDSKWSFTNWYRTALYCPN